MKRITMRIMKRTITLTPEQADYIGRLLTLLPHTYHKPTNLKILKARLALGAITADELANAVRLGKLTA